MRFIFTRVSSRLPVAAGGGVVSGFDSFGLDGDMVGFVSVIGGSGASFRPSGGGGDASLGFKLPARRLSSVPREHPPLGHWRQYL